MSMSNITVFRYRGVDHINLWLGGLEIASFPGSPGKSGWEGGSPPLLIEESLGTRLGGVGANRSVIGKVYKVCVSSRKEMAP